MKKEDLKQNVRYKEVMGGIVTIDNKGEVWLYDGYTNWRVSEFVEFRQKEIFDSLKEIKE